MPSTLVRCPTRDVRPSGTELEQHQRGIDVVRPGTGGTGATEIRPDVCAAAHAASKPAGPVRSGPGQSANRPAGHRHGRIGPSRPTGQPGTAMAGSGHRHDRNGAPPGRLDCPEKGSPGELPRSRNGGQEANANHEHWPLTPGLLALTMTANPFRREARAIAGGRCGHWSPFGRRSRCAGIVNANITAWRSHARRALDTNDLARTRQEVTRPSKPEHPGALPARCPLRCPAGDQPAMDLRMRKAGSR
jgi:hypothetical protein